MITAKQKVQLHYLEKTQMISSPEKNLRTKIESLLRNLEQLESKKSRLDYEIRKQKKSLIRKREELKKASKSLKTRTSLVQESLELNGNFNELEAVLEIRKLDNILLQESNQILDNI